MYILCECEGDRSPLFSFLREFFETAAKYIFLPLSCQRLVLLSEGSFWCIFYLGRQINMLKKLFPRWSPCCKSRWLVRSFVSKLFFVIAVSSFSLKFRSFSWDSFFCEIDWMWMFLKSKQIGRIFSFSAWHLFLFWNTFFLDFLSLDFFFFFSRCCQWRFSIEQFSEKKNMKNEWERRKPVRPPCEKKDWLHLSFSSSSNKVQRF